MSKIDDLINKLCPDGVEYCKLEKIVKEVNIGINPRKFFKLNPIDATGFYVTVRELNGLLGVKQYDKTDKINNEAIKIINDRAHIEKGDILFSNTGTVGKLALISEEAINWGVNEGIYIIKPVMEKITSKFLYYYLDSSCAYKDYSAKFTGSTLKHITQKALLSLTVPVPPLEVQDEIVHILDDFTLLSAELSAELKARQEQYEYYKNKLLEPKDNWNSISMEELCELITKQTGFDYSATIKPALVTEKNENTLSFIQNKDFSGEYFNYNTDYYIPKDIVEKFPKITLDMPSILFSISGKVGNVGLFENKKKAFIGGAICICKLKENNPIINKYILYYSQSKYGQKYLFKSIKAASHLNITVEAIRNMRIFYPPIDEQEKIINILSKFDKICNDLIDGLPAEIEARQKQYEYYRDKLLTFKELKVSEV